MRRRRKMRAVCRSLPRGQELLRRRDLALVLALSERTILRYRTAGLLPEPLRLGGVLRWSRRTLQRWIDAGCPSAVARDDRVPGVMPPVRVPGRSLA